MGIIDGHKAFSKEQRENSVITIENAHVRFYALKSFLRRVAVHALSGLSLAIAPAETVAVVGESGSGKTTLGRVSLRVIDVESGLIRFRGEDITHASGQRLKGFRRLAQAIFQDPYSSINPYMTIGQNVEEPLLIHNRGGKSERLERVERALGEVKLSPSSKFLTQHPHTLSGGQRQRVGIARALVMDPAYIVADEPVSMVDASSKAELLYLLRETYKKYGIASLYITHDIASAKHIADRIAVMYLGRIIEVGPPSEIIENPLHPYTQGLIESVPEPDPTNRKRFRRVIPGESPNPTNIPSGCPFHPRCAQFINGLCEVQTPILKEQSNGRSVACHLYS